MDESERMRNKAKQSLTNGLKQALLECLLKKSRFQCANRVLRAQSGCGERRPPRFVRLRKNPGQSGSNIGQIDNFSPGEKLFKTTQTETFFPFSLFFCFFLFRWRPDEGRKSRERPEINSSRFSFELILRTV